MKIVKCCLQGAKHKSVNSPCEDACFFAEENGVFVVSVADGAGSSKYSESRFGSDNVSQTVCRLMIAHFDELFEMTNEFELRRIIEVVCKNELQKKAAEISLDTYDTFATTVLFVAIKENKAIAGQIGDGVIGRKLCSVFENITTPQNGEYASSTYFITHPEAYQYLQIHRFFVNNTSHIFLMTDGLSERIYDEKSGCFNGVINQIINFADDDNGEQLLKECIRENVICADDSSDDTTLAIICLDENSNRNEDEENELPDNDNSPKKGIKRFKFFGKS